jgi:hypothetical protein
MVEIRDLADLAGRVTLEREHRVFADHTGPVVRDADLGLSAVPDGDLDPGGVRVEGVLDQLLDDGGRPLDDKVSRPHTYRNAAL